MSIINHSTSSFQHHLFRQLLSDTSAEHHCLLLYSAISWLNNGKAPNRFCELSSAVASTKMWKQCWTTTSWPKSAFWAAYCNTWMTWINEIWDYSAETKLSVIIWNRRTHSKSNWVFSQLTWAHARCCIFQTYAKALHQHKSLMWWQISFWAWIERELCLLIRWILLFQQWMGHSMLKQKGSFPPEQKKMSLLSTRSPCNHPLLWDRSFAQGPTKFWSYVNTHQFPNINKGTCESSFSYTVKSKSRCSLTDSTLQILQAKSHCSRSE